MGNVTVGLLTDKAIATYRTLPYNDFKKRELIIKNIKYVQKVIPQNTLDYSENLKLIKPEYVVHGRLEEGNTKNIRKNVIKTLKLWKGKLIEIPYTKKFHIKKLKKKHYRQARHPILENQN